MRRGAPHLRRADVAVRRERRGAGLAVVVAAVGACTTLGAIASWAQSPAVPPAAAVPAAPVPPRAPPVVRAPAGPAKPAVAQVPALPSAPLVTPSSAETQFHQRMDTLLAPLMAVAPSAEDASRIGTAVAAIGQLNFARARELEAQITDPVARKLVRWALLRSDALPATAAEIEELRKASPDFAEQGLLRQRAEETLLHRNSDPAAIKAFFEASPPQSGAGLVALAAAHLGSGDRAKAQALAARAWRESDLSLRNEELLLNTLGGLLTPADHKWRLDRLLMRDIRWTKERAERAAIARRTARYLSEAERAKAEARIAVYLRQKDAARLIAALPADAMKDWGVYFSVVQLNRRAGADAEDDDAAPEPADGNGALGGAVEGGAAKAAEAPQRDATRLKEAWRLLLAAPTDPSLIVSPDDWWIERRVNAYVALKAGQPRIAYDLVRNPGPLSVNPLKDAHMLAGWIALRHLGDAKMALGHFTAMRKAADGPISMATSEYWLGRTRVALGEGEEAKAHYRRAAAYYDTFYGLLARQTLEPAVSSLRVGVPAEPTPEEVRSFLARDGVRAVLVARRAGFESFVRPQLAHLRHYLSTKPGELALVAHLSVMLGDMQWTVRTGKVGMARGQNLALYAYPVTAFPRYQPLRPPPETAFLMGIARQESEFNTLTQSGAGARGVLQVMPITARHVCRDYKVRCEIGRLLTDPAYNTTMASAYIGDRMSEMGGSYVMTLAGYNAGPGRVRQWVREFGDPRQPGVDVIDWIERIPFEETREYVKKVLANIQIYRARLGDEERALQLLRDLGRASGGQETGRIERRSAEGAAPARGGGEAN